MSPRDLLRTLTDAIARDPLLVPQVLQAVSAGVAGFEAACRQQRDGVARNALTMLMGGRKRFRKGVGLGEVLDAAYCQFPTGLTANGHAPCEVRYWHDFLEVARREEFPSGLADWLETTRGPDCLRWWTLYVAPHL